MYKIVCVGKIKEDFIIKGINEYTKRISGFTKLEIIEVKEVNTNNINNNILEEGNNILKKINKDDYVITLEIEGKSIDSVELSKQLETLRTYGNSSIVFVIGGSNGLSDDVKKRSNYKLSFSKFTFPHQLMRLILVEQIYRSLTIENNKEYHK
jgi:23S rRNA (pseudouridine1915-N3)-methyltransferase